MHDIKKRNFLIKVNNDREYKNVLERIKELGEHSEKGGLAFTDYWCYVGYYSNWECWCLSNGDKSNSKYDYIISYNEFMSIGLEQEHPQYEVY